MFRRRRNPNDVGDEEGAFFMSFEPMPGNPRGAMAMMP